MKKNQQVLQQEIPFLVKGLITPIAAVAGRIKEPYFKNSRLFILLFLPELFY